MQVPEDKFNNPQENFLYGLTPNDVDKVFAADGLKCSSDQREFIEWVRDNPRATLGVSAVAGAAKTTLGVGIAAAVKRKLVGQQHCYGW